MPSSKLIARQPLNLLAVAILYMSSYRLVDDQLAPEQSEGLFFIASGIGLAALLLGGRIYALSVFVGALLANWNNGFSLSVAMMIAFGCTLSVLISATLVTYKHEFDFELRSFLAYLRLIVFGGFLGSIVGALVGVMTLELVGVIKSEQFLTMLLNWSMDATLGAVLITPLLLVWCKKPSYLFNAKNCWIILLIMAGTWFVGQIVFLGWFLDWLGLSPKGYWLFAIVALAARYLGRHGMLLLLTMVIIQAMLSTAKQVGFFAHNSMINFWFYSISLSLVGITLAIRIDQRDVAEAELKASEMYFRRFVMQSPIAIAVGKIDGTIELFNERFTSVFGYTQADIPNLEIWWSLAYPDPDYRADRKALWQQVVMLAIAHNTDIAPVECRVSCKNGEQRNIIIHGALIGERILVYLDDITEHRRMESALRDSLEQFSNIFNKAPLGITQVNSLTGEIYACNPAFAKMLGRTVEQVVHGTWMEVTHPDDVEKDLQQMALLNAGKINSFSIEKRFIRPDGTIVSTNLSVAPMLVEDKSHPLHHCIIEDITERKQLEDAYQFLLECGYKRLNEDFFASLALYLSETLGMEFVCIDRLEPDSLIAETVALYTDGQFQDNIQYTLEDTPCGVLIGQTICCFDKDVQHLFPKDSVLKEMQAESYIGTTLWGFNGKPNGLIALLSRKPLQNKKLAENLLKSVSIRAAGELERQRIETELRIAATVFEAQEGMFITDANKIILKVNQAFTNITGYSPQEAIGQTPLLFRSGRQNPEFYQKLWDTIEKNSVWCGEIWNRRKNGEIYPEWLSITAVKSGSANKVTHYVATLVDITERKNAEEQIKQLAFYDVLTGLPNRRSLFERIKYSIQLAQREHKQIAILMLDLDKFKPVNDGLGHAVGDELLKQVADRIQGRLRHIDMVARLGGDEFVILLDQINQTEAVARVATDIIDILSQPFMLQNNQVQIGASVGISLYPDHGDNPNVLIDNADAALYLAKKQGRGCFAYFSEQLTAAAHKRMALETRLRLAIDQQELCIHYQPQMNMHNQRITGAEALVRWQDPKIGLVFPDDFMPIAETSNLFLLINEWVLREACQQGTQWLNAGFKQFVLTVNISAQQFQRSHFADFVIDILQDTGFPADYLELEVTEANLIHYQDQILNTLTKLNQQGVQLAIDDFGTGWSSLAILKRFPLSRLKIGKTFMDDIPFSTTSMTITQAIIAMASNLGFEVLAKNVETAEQLAFLQAHGCDSYQGYLYSPALEVSAFVDLWQQQNSQKTH